MMSKNQTRNAEASRLVGDRAAITQLLDLQREGKALRLYPHGRKGPLDEGVGPVIIEPTEDLLIRIRLGRYETIIIPKEDIAKYALFMMRITAMMYFHHEDADDPATSIEEKVTPGFGYITQVAQGGLALTLRPHGALDFEFGWYHARKLLDDWCVLIEQNDWDYLDCGFQGEEYFDLLAFLDE
jgi:hypothetical protein